MDKIDRKVLEELLVKNAFDLTLQNNAGKEISIEKMLSLVIKGDGCCELKCTGYKVTSDREETAETLEKLYKLLDKAEAANGEYILLNIGGRFATVEEMREQIAFDNISMDGLLKRYPTADRFSLTGDYGDVHLDEESARAALKEIADEQYRTAESQYLLIPESDRESLPPFDKLFEEITNECLAYRKKHAKLIKKYNGGSAFCDVFATGKGKYNKPHQLWHLYHAADFIDTCAYNLQRLKRIKEEAPIDRQLEGLPVLKESLISAKPTFVTHCTTGGELSTVFTFKLDGKTREWLKARKDDYDFGYNGQRLDDLALYCGDKILFSSCTHEHYHCDCSKSRGEI